MPELAGLAFERDANAQTMAALQGKSAAEMQRRFRDGHRAYVARLHGTPAAWGWVATREATIGELNAAFLIPEKHRYLWNFVTLEPHRGMGIYPRLLNAIIRAEQGAEQFWIAYAPENRASAAGIHKAGVITLAELSFDASGAPAVKSIVRDGGVQAAQVLGFPTQPRCWRPAGVARVPWARQNRPAAPVNVPAIISGRTGTARSNGIADIVFRTPGDNSMPCSVLELCT